jgi:hypothetical protein
MNTVMRLAMLAAPVFGSGCTESYQTPPLAIDQNAPDGYAPLDQDLAVIGGRLALSRDGESRLPYNIRPELTPAALPLRRARW